MSTSSSTGFDARDLSASRLYDGVRTRRILAFVADYTLVSLLWCAAVVVVFLLGIITLGLGWALYAVLFPLIALLYVAATLGGRSQATPGMRLMGLRLERLDGGGIDPMTALLHTVLFWAGNVLTSGFILLVALFTPKKQLVQDILLGTVIVRTR